MPKSKTFHLQNIANRGNRGRPPLPREVNRMHELVLNSRGVELGELEIEPDESGAVVITAVIDGKSKSITFPAPARKPARKARPASSKASKPGRPKRTRSRPTQVFDGDND